MTVLDQSCAKNRFQNSVTTECYTSKVKILFNFATLLYQNRVQSCAKIFRENVKKVKGFVDLLSKVFNFATHRHFLHKQPFIF
jgi:hypothetical protein